MEKELSVSAKNKESFYAELRNKRFRQINAFENVHGEFFEVYFVRGLEDVFVTGDELDWETGWKFDKYNKNKLSKEFIMSAEETNEVINAIKSFNGEGE